ncbi:hypothetical protein F0267_22620 [Vibrio coralliilyticus]|uniref:Uncharacterized protein n=1 Tax=Vibrio coralliilyticus TaxID=190893 RepID=A0AAN0S9U1_9VIBR|nr:hypothetical protein [Vibrio coralliilyticus]AIW18349.1 hypothetical protein IX92_04505 [Vibrio coralliilyticus]NOH41024.1 hypothetical protein [Vibrio coralliilyticus]
MIEQKFQQPGLLAETEVNPLFPRMADLVLVFFPSPGVFARNTLTIPDEFKTEATVFYEADGEPFEEMYVFLPAVLQSQYDAGKNQSGIVYSKDGLKFEPALIQALADQVTGPIEHRSG